MPPSRPIVGSRIWSVRRPARTKRDVHGEQRAQVGHEEPRVRRREEVHVDRAAVELRRVELFGRTERRRPDEQRDARRGRAA